MSNQNGKVEIVLSDAEALVFFHWLSKINEKEDSSLFDDQSERRVLWDLESSLEEKIFEVVSENYFETLQSAREIVRDKD